MQDDNSTDSHAKRSHDDSTESAGDEKKYWLDDLRNVRKIYRALWIVCALLVTADLLYEKHIELVDFTANLFRWRIELPIERVVGFFGFYGFYGFVSCVFLVLAAKQLRKIVGRGEDYYDR
ncbi:MAG: hypothetical protein IH849_07810, partial [Acidobacteria bacterium]|nr:hypothetical protein [Acidobacteriota bacterium]